MGPLFAYSLVPVISVSLLLFFTATLRGRNARGLAMFCLTVAVTSGSMFLLCFAATATVGERLAAVGAFTVAGYLHAAYDMVDEKRRGPLYRAYAVAVLITLLGVLEPQLLYGPLAATRGPLFWPALAVAVASAAVPMAALRRGYRRASPQDRATLRSVAIAGVLAYAGGVINALLISGGRPLPFGLFLVLAALLVLANVVRSHETAGHRRLLERSLLYSGLAALLSAGFLFGVMSWMSRANEPFLAQYRAGALFLLFMAALAVEPLRQQIQLWVGKRLLPHRADTEDLATALAASEQRADQAQRLAELGQFVSAVAHEVRNPLGVLSAYIKVIDRNGPSEEALQSMREQIDRASHFVDELLRYGRPRPLELRPVDLDATVDLAWSTARQGLGGTSHATLERVQAPTGATVEADQAQLLQLLVILTENALLALANTERACVRITVMSADSGGTVRVEDNGPGIPPELAPRLFQPFVTGRKREGPGGGTGLGLAIARGIAERHRGTLIVRRSDLGGACFELTVPRWYAVG